MQTLKPLYLPSYFGAFSNSMLGSAEFSLQYKKQHGLENHIIDAILYQHAVPYLQPATFELPTELQLNDKQVLLLPQHVREFCVCLLFSRVTLPWLCTLQTRLIGSKFPRCKCTFCYTLTNKIRLPLRLFCKMYTFRGHNGSRHWNHSVKRNCYNAIRLQYQNQVFLLAIANLQARKPNCNCVKPCCWIH